MIGLRDYQHSMVGRLLRTTARRPIAVLPTGAGKTHVAVAVILDAVERGERVLAVAHREELLGQMRARLAAAGLPDSPLVTVVSIQAVARRGTAGPFGLIVIDEAHHAVAASYRALLDAHPDARVLGLTATPSRLDGKPLGDVFDEIVEGPSVASLVEAGHLASPRYFAPATADATRSMVEGVRTTAGDFDRGALDKKINTRTLVGNIVVHWTKHAAGASTIVFAASVSHADSIARRFARSGVSARVVTGKTSPKERAAALAAFRSGELTVLVNYDLFGEGLDVPGVRCVVLARPTQSLTVYRQQCGRAMRPGPGAPVVLDHAGNVWRHNLPTMPVEWSLVGAVKRESGGPIVRRCSVCGEVLAGSSCPCGGVVRAERLDPEEAEWKRLVELAAGSGVGYQTLYQRIHLLGWSADAAATEPAQGTRSHWAQWRLAAEANGVTYASFTSRLRRGLDPKTAAVTTPKSPLWTAWKHVAERNGICMSAFYARVNSRGMAPEDAASMPLRARIPRGELWEKWKATATRHGVSEDLFSRRLERWSAERSATTSRASASLRLRRDAPEQAVCAGWIGSCPDKAEPGIQAFYAQAVRRRGGAPWRCQRCAAAKRVATRRAKAAQKP